MKPFRVLVPLAGAAASALLLTACGSSGGGGGGSTSATDTGTASSSAPAPSTSASSSAPSTGSAPTKAQLQKIVLQPSDVPSYTAAAPDPDSDSGDNSLDTQLEACTGVKGAPDSHKVATVESQDFKKGDVTVSSEFSSYQSASDVAADVAQLKSPKINQCLNSAFKTELAKSAGAGTTVTSAAIKLTPGTNGGPSNVAGLASGAVGISVNGQKAVVYLGIAFVTGPQLDGTLTYIGINSRPDVSFQQSVLAAVAKRAQNP